VDIVLTHYYHSKNKKTGLDGSASEEIINN
jgi:hypothetical protein